MKNDKPTAPPAQARGEMKNLNVRVPGDTLRALKVYAAKHDVTLAQACVEIVSKGARI